MMKQPRGQELIDRYRTNYGIADDVVITEKMILRHWELEKHLTQALLLSQPKFRWETFNRCYTTLYRELEWLNCSINADIKAANLDQKYATWVQLIGPPPKRVYEVGSGKGELMRYLASRGYECRATEITLERGRKWTNDIPGLSWGRADGIHLGCFEPANTYDVIISDQLIEHLHPDDLVEHFRGGWNILVDGGRYIFRTPHVHDGPWDISRVFKCDKPMGMHFKEYTFRELVMKLKQAGFQYIYTKMPNCNKIQRLLGRYCNSIAFRTTYLNYLYIIERLIKTLPKQTQRRKAVQKASRLFLFLPHITMIAQKQEAYEGSGRGRQ